MQPLGYYVPKQQKLGWGALGDDASDAGVVYSPPDGWSIDTPPTRVTSSNQASFSYPAPSYSCNVLSLAVAGDPLPDGTLTYMPPLGWLVAGISKAGGDSWDGQYEQATIWIDPNSKVSYKLDDCTSNVVGAQGGAGLVPAGFSPWGLFGLLALVGGGLLALRYVKDKKKRKPRRKARKPKRKTRRTRRSARRRR
jgi:hypothetical protein